MLFIWGNLLIQCILIHVCIFIVVYVNYNGITYTYIINPITQKLASAYKANIFCRIFEQTTVGKTTGKFYTLPYRSNHRIHTPSKHVDKRTEKPSEHTLSNTCGTVKCKVPND
jgi:hypothetical protein